LLTHTTPPPPDFTSDNAAAYGSMPFTSSWRQIHGALRASLTRRPKEEASWLFITEQLVSFLEEHAMASSDLKPSDIASANLFANSRQNFEGVFAEIAAEVVRRFKADFTAKSMGVCEFDWTSRVIGGWLYFDNKSRPKDCYLGWVVRLPEGAEYWNDCTPALPEWDHAAIYFGANDDRQLVYPEQLTSSWSITADRTRLILAKPLGTLAAGRFPETFVAWIEATMPDARKLEAANTAPD
jgi:hypothetical protein